MTIDRPTMNVLFVCTGNSARSILAESILNHPAIGQGRFRAFSAGSHPAGQVQPLALELLSQYHYPTEGLRSKNWNEFSGEGAPELDFVFTVCDKAAGEACPVYFGPAVKAHWGLEDPSDVNGDEASVQAAFDATLETIATRCRAFFALPFSQLTPVQLKAELERIAGLQAVRHTG